MKKLIILFLFSFLIGINSSWSQINFSEMLQPNKIAKDEVSKLFFIDFWATWCAPCIHVAKYLTVLQKQYPEDLYIISLTQENPEKVKKFLLKHTTDLAIAIDYDGETFYKNGISSLPSGILVNAKGSILWEGHPAELKSEMIAKFLRNNKQEAAINEIINFKKESEDNQEFVTYKPEQDFEFFEDNDSTDVQLKILQTDEFLELKGKLRDIIAFSNKSHVSQIKMDESLDKNYRMYFRNNNEVMSNMFEVILSSLNLRQKIKSNTRLVLELSLKNPRFWDAFQIEFTNTSKRYQIGKLDLKADNITISEFGYLISKVSNKPLILNGIEEENTLHDWQIHYKFFDLMKSDLLDNYGIEIEEKELNIPIYKIIKKAP